METISFNFFCKVVRKTDDGFTALLDVLGDSYLIKFRDTKYRYFFDSGDTLKITMENVAEASREEARVGYAIIYVVIHVFLSNGFLFRDTSAKGGFFWANRGILTHKKFEKDNLGFEEDNILKIVIKKI